MGRGRIFGKKAKFTLYSNSLTIAPYRGAILDAVEALCHQAGLSTERRNIPTVKKQNGKTGQGDLVVKGANIGGGIAKMGPIEKRMGPIALQVARPTPP